MVEHNVGGVIEARRQVGDRLVPKLVDLEDAVVDVGDTIDVVLKDVNAEGMAQPWGSKERTRAVRGGSGADSTAGRSLPWTGLMDFGLGPPTLYKVGSGGDSSVTTDSGPAVEHLTSKICPHYHLLSIPDQ